MMFYEGFREMCEYLGFAVIAIIIFLYVMWFFTWLTKVLKKQTKIKCLCHHEYELKYKFEYKFKTEYELKCRKCGRTKSMTIYHKEGSDLK